MRSLSAGPRKVIAPSMAAFGTAPQATRSTEYGIAAPRGRVCEVAGGIHRDELALRRRCACLRGQRIQLEAPYLAELEGLGDRQRPVPEVGLGSEQLDGDPVFGKRSQRERCLEGGNASSGDEHCCLVASSHRGPQFVGGSNDTHDGCADEWRGEPREPGSDCGFSAGRFRSPPRRATPALRTLGRTKEAHPLTLLWFVVWLISNLVGDTESLTFDPVNWWAGLLILAIALDLSRQHAPQLGRTPTRRMNEPECIRARW